MKWMIECIFFLFRLLSRLRLREKIIRRVAFNPPTLSYTLRELSQNNEYNSDASFVNTINESLAQTIEYSHKSTEKYLVSKQFKQNSQDMKRSFLLKDKLVQRRKKHHKKALINDNLSKPFLSVFDQHSSFKPTLHQVYYRPINQQYYPPYQMKLINQRDSLFDLDPLDNISITSYILPTKNHQSIATLFLEIQSAKIDYVLLFSHGNATDLGDMLDTFADLAYTLNVNVFGYDYQGYGQSTGHADDLSAMYDIEAAYSFLVTQLRFNPTKIIVYGFSLGSGPSVALASQTNYVVGGLILHSGLSSGLRILDTKMKRSQFFDFFPNVDLISAVRCPILIMHGTNDQEIPCSHSLLLKTRCQGSCPCVKVWFFEEGGHNNLDTDERFRAEYIRLVSGLVSKVQMDNATVDELQVQNQSLAVQMEGLLYGRKLKEVFDSCFECLERSTLTRNHSIDVVHIRRHKSDITK